MFKVVASVADRLVARAVPRMTAKAADCGWEKRPGYCAHRWCCYYPNGHKSCGGWVSTWPNC